jgi:GNAT superfamily N-acetyltransferase
MELTIDPVRSDADFQAMIDVCRLTRPESFPAAETLRHNLEAKEQLEYLVAWLGDEPVSCAYVEPRGSVAAGDVAVVPARRGQGIGSAVLAEVSRLARELGKDTIQGEVKQSDPGSRAYLERRGFAAVGAEQAVVLELDELEPPEIDPPPGVRIVSRAEEPDRLEDMYAIAVQADEDIPGSTGRWTFEDWRAHEIDKPTNPPELCFIALAGEEVVGYASLQVHRQQTFHGLTATRRDWRRRGVATALKRAEIAAAKAAGLHRLLTESEERNEPMRTLNEKLGYVPAPEWSTVVMRGPLA